MFRFTPKTLMRAEGALFLVVSIFIYTQLEAAWWLFVLLFLVPEISRLGYLRGQKWGSYSYNVFHTYLTPAFILLIALMNNYEILVAITVIWIANIGLNRSCGFGLRSIKEVTKIPSDKVVEGSSQNDF